MPDSQTAGILLTILAVAAVSGAIYGIRSGRRWTAVLLSTVAIAGLAFLLVVLVASWLIGYTSGIGE